MGAKLEIHIDRDRPPRMTFVDTGGEPILAFHDRDGTGWVLHVQHYEPFPMRVAAFDGVSEALDKARNYLKMPLPSARRLPGRSVSLRSERCPGGNSYFLAATLEQDGVLTLRGQNLGPDVSYDGEYEYWYTVKAESVADMVIALGGEPGADIIDLLEKRWSGDAATGLGKAIERSGVRYEFFNYF